MQIAQWIAAHAVAKVIKGHNLTQSLPKAMHVCRDANPQQKGAAQDYSYNALRFYAEARFYLDALATKPVSDPTLQALLIVALAQLSHTQEDDFTVVNQAVTAAGMSKKSWGKGLVNAILRNFLRQKSVLKTQAEQSLEAQWNYPAWWIQKVQTQYAKDWQSILSTGNQHPPMTLRVNLSKIVLADYMLQLEGAGIASMHLGGEAIQLNQAMPVTQVPGFTQGLVSVQDAGAQWAAHLLDVADGMRVLDACSAPGGKTCHVLERSNVEMTAIDSDAERLQRVQSNLSRLGLQARLLQGDASQADWYDGQPFDRILADVPCSASGIVRRHVDLKWLRRPSDLAKFSAQQFEILTNLWKMLAKDGKLLYVTCSIFAEENEQQIERFLSLQPEAKRLSLDFSQVNLPAHQRAGQLIPCNQHDGLFYALLQKMA